MIYYDKDGNCKVCGTHFRYSEKYDSEYCEKCDTWLIDKCDDPGCLFCCRRPEKPSQDC